jgi:hypothetical protein
LQLSTTSPIKTRTSSSVSWQEGAIVRTELLPGTEQTLADAVEHTNTIRIVAAGHRPPLLVDMRGMKSQSRDARQHYGSPEVVDITCAVALLVESRVTMLIANFFITVTKVSVPTKIFTDEAAALAWLNGFLA